MVIFHGYVKEPDGNMSFNPIHNPFIVHSQSLKSPEYPTFFFTMFLVKNSREIPTTSESLHQGDDPVQTDHHSGRKKLPWCVFCFE